MRKALLTLFITLCCISKSFAVKTPYIPAYLLDPNTNDGAQFTWSKTAESANFIIIWGNTVGLDPSTYPDPNLAFNPANILDTMEMLYAFYAQTGFLNDSPGTNLAQYKIPIVIYGTWGVNGAQGFANGGDADGVIGAFWVHPTAMLDGRVAAHELTHSLQAQCQIDFRTTYGFGPAYADAGIFWETHANFMRNLKYPSTLSAWGMDVYHIQAWGDWKNTYECYELLMSIYASEGIEMINRMWKESYTNEYPLHAYKRLAGYNQSRFNDSMYKYARRMPTFDFTNNNWGTYFRQYRADDMNNYLPSVQGVYDILKKNPAGVNRYEMPIWSAPEEYGYNVIPLHVNPDSCSVIIKFKGHTEVNAHAGWRYGFVAELPNGTIGHYSPTYSDTAKEINFELQGNETKMYLVVMGAPKDSITTTNLNDTWLGYPKHFRFPYELTISGAVPEGFQDSNLFRQQLKVNGHIHSNGGGWVQNTATVAGTVYVGPMAMVLGTANLSGFVRVENTALVKDATMTSNVIVQNNAFIIGGTYGLNTIIKGQAYVENCITEDNPVVEMRARVANYHLHGNIRVGGDVVVYNNTGDCDNGVYYVMTNYYADNLLQCDNRDETHPDNVDVNNTYSSFSNAQMAMICNCAILPNCLFPVSVPLQVYNSALKVYPNPASAEITFDAEKKTITSVLIYNAVGSLVSNTQPHNSSTIINTSSLPTGIYMAITQLSDGTTEQVKITVQR